MRFTCAKHDLATKPKATIGDRAAAHPLSGSTMPSPFQEQLLKAGLLKKQELHRNAKTKPAVKVDGRQLQAERAERDRLLAAERNVLARANELRAQVRELVEKGKLKREGEDSYRFVDEGKVKSLLINASLRQQLASGALVIVAHGEHYELVPRAVAEKIYERGGVIAVDHGRTPSVSEANPETTEDDHYKQFAVPDDLIW